MTSRKIVLLSSLLIAICFLAGPSLAEAKPKTKPRARNGLVQIIQNPKVIHNSETGSYDLQVAVVIPKSLDAVWSGKAEAWLVVCMTSVSPGQSPAYFQQIQLTGENAGNGHTWSRNHRRNLITIKASDTQNLQKGDYQIGLVLTYSGAATPTLLSNWYGGFSGLVSVSRLTVTLGSETTTGSGDSSGESATGLPM